ncbi:sperm acrosome membrane-associated protein 4 [Brienomyrus brachyistius]|uniref:sperm acrosome membrane-associated protein 4 n=1 Tax=Brienomyrus brachyistius TaxID=42636 RepID=UPI0020B3062C|nr:sperm acrosome membrane-associated protein 4 [Brienomyrus brachyistius]
MNRILCGVFALGLVFAVAQAQLQCYKCDIGFFGACITTTTTCSGLTDQCFNGVGTAALFMKINMKGCLAVSSCNQTSDVAFGSNSNSTIYKMTKTCCSTNLCNLAPRGAYGSLLSITLLTLTGAMITGALV